MSRSAFAYICEQCDHPMSIHRSVAGDIDGFYRCAAEGCGHAFTQNYACYDLNRQQWREYLAGHPEVQQILGSI